MKTHAIILIAFLAGGYGHSAAAACQSIPQGVEQAPVEFCDSWSAVSLRVGDRKKTYDKSEFSHAWREIVSHWLSVEQIGLDLLDGARVEYWLSVPEVNPSAAQMRLQIAPRSGPRFLLAGSPFPEDWDLTAKRIDVAILQTGKYPEDFGFRAGELLIQSQKKVNTKDLIDHLERYGNGRAIDSGSSWYTLPVKPLSEGEVVRALLEDPATEALIKEVYFNSLYEWIAYRQRAFAFFWY